MPPEDVLRALEAKSKKDPFRVGNRGDVYLDSLTGDHGWEEVRRHARAVCALHLSHSSPQVLPTYEEAARK